MAELLHKSPSSYSRMESGEIKIALEELPEIAKILDCTLDDLLQGLATLNVQHNNNQVFAQHVQNQTNSSEDLINQFKVLMTQVLEHQSKSEEKMQLFMKEIIGSLRK